MPRPASPADQNPLPRWLRGRVLALRVSTTRRLFAGRVELVAVPAAETDAPAAAWTYGDPAETPLDHALRVDVLVRLLTGCACQGVRAVTVVHVRRGPHEPGDHDMAWAAAARVAAGISGVDVERVVALGRWGWHDLATGAERSWVRLRRVDNR